MHHHWLTRNRNLALTVLLAYVALASAGQLIHTEAPCTSPDTGQCSCRTHHATTPPEVVSAAGMLRERGDCLACVWASHSQRSGLLATAAGLPIPLLVRVPVAAPRHYLAPSLDLAAIRAPPHA